jgi:signal transduction histidine kinase
MRKLLYILFFCLLGLTSFASEAMNLSNNNLINTYYLNAELYLKKNQKDCIYWANKAIEESTSQENYTVLCKSYFIKGKAYELLAHYNKAISNYLQSENVAKTNNLSDLELLTLKQIAELYAHIGNFKMAVEYSELLRVQKDSSEVAQLKVLSKDLPGKVALDKKERKVKQLIADKSELDNHLRSNLHTIDNQGRWILVIVIGYSLVFISFLWINRQNKAILKKNLLLITQQDKLENGKDALEHARFKAEESDRLKTAFLANISYETRTPLNSIMGFSELLRDKSFNISERKKFIEIIHHHSDALLKFVVEIFDAARIESGEIIQNTEIIDINEFLREIHTFYSLKSDLASKKGIELVLFLQFGETSYRFKTVPERLRKVMSHLVEDAIRRSANGKVEFGYKVIDSLIQFFVKDNNQAFDKEQLDGMFERFKQNRDVSNHDDQGVGIGLTIIRNYIESMGGYIWIMRNKDNGSTFFFTLPIY